MELTNNKNGFETEKIDNQLVNSILSTRINNLKNQFSYDPLIGESKAMREVFELIDKTSKSDIKVFIFGETGTSKESFVNKIIHSKIKRNGKSFIIFDFSRHLTHLLRRNFLNLRVDPLQGITKSNIERLNSKIEQQLNDSNN